MLKSGSAQCIPNVDPRKIATTFTALFTEEFLLSAIQMVLKCKTDCKVLNLFHSAKLLTKSVPRLCVNDTVLPFVSYDGKSKFYYAQ